VFALCFLSGKLFSLHVEKPLFCQFVHCIRCMVVFPAVSLTAFMRFTISVADSATENSEAFLTAFMVRQCCADPPNYAVHYFLLLPFFLEKPGDARLHL